MDSIEKESTGSGLLDRFRKSWFPPAAVVGAFSAFVAAAFRVRANPKAAPRPAQRAGMAKPLVQVVLSPPPARVFEREYTQAAVLVGAASAHPFRRSLAGIAVGAGDRVYALGDDEVRTFDAGGNLVRNWRAPENAACLAAGTDERLYVGAGARVEIYDAGGSRVGGFVTGEKNRPASITALKVFGQEVLVADAASRIIRRCDSSGRQLGVIGTSNKTGGFILPNRSLDIAVDSKGVILATDTGRHRVTAWAIDGTLLRAFGKFGMSSPEDFVGCCNPVNVALAPDGKVLTAEKMIPRVKVYEPDGRLLGVIGPEHFAPDCIHIYLAADSRGRILAADPVRREIKVFSRLVKVAVNEHHCEELKRA